MQLAHKSIRSMMAGHYRVGRRESEGNVVPSVRVLTPSPSKESINRAVGLTRRDLEIVAAIVAGYTNKDMARKFALSERAVKRHLTSIFGKLGVSNRLELALFATSHRLV